MTEERRSSRGRRAGDQTTWSERHSTTLAQLIVVLFVVLAVLGFGITASARVANDALGLNREGNRQRQTLLRQVGDLRRQNDRLASQDGTLRQEVEALRAQVEKLGATPVIVNEHGDGTSPTSTTLTTQPPPRSSPPPSTTTTTVPCRVTAAGDKCVVR